MSGNSYSEYHQGNKGTYIESLVAGSITPESSGTNYHVYIRENDTLQTSSRIRVGETPNQVDIHPNAVDQVLSTTPTGVSILQPLNMNAQAINAVLDPVLAQDCATKAYVDSSSGAVALDSVLLAGNSAGATAIDMNSNLINNVLNPVGPQDAATKNYVDGFASSTTLNTTFDGVGATSAAVNVKFAKQGNVATITFVDGVTITGDGITNANIVINTLFDAAYRPTSQVGGTIPAFINSVSGEYEIRVTNTGLVYIGVPGASLADTITANAGTNGVLPGVTWTYSLV